MKLRILPFIFLALFYLAPLAHGTTDGFIWINVSVKMIVDPATGTVKTGGPGVDGVDDDLLRSCFDQVNLWQATTGRGYRVRLVDLNPDLSFKRIGTKEQSPSDTNPAYWYNVNIKGGDLGTILEQNRNDFDDRATANANNAYLWNPNAVNIYVNNDDYSSTSASLIITSYRLIAEATGPNYYKNHREKISANLHHEIGHYFGLPHTFEYIFLDTAYDDKGADDQGIFDRFAQNNFHLDFSQLSFTSQTRITNTVFNVMSYHQAFGWATIPPQDWFVSTNILTPKQLDRYADTANSTKRSNVSGSTVFVDSAADTNGSGSSTAPCKTLASGVAAASNTGSDILVLRTGTYHATTLNKPMTLRAATGVVTLQHP